MSVHTLPKTLERIKQTDPERQVAVFRCQEIENIDCYDIFCSATYQTQQRIKAGDEFFIGEFHRQTPQDVINLKFGLS